MAEKPNEVQIREALQRAMTLLVDRGASSDMVAEEAFTVALANLAAVKGARRAAYASLAAGAGLQALADQAEADAQAAKH